MLKLSGKTIPSVPEQKPESAPVPSKSKKKEDNKKSSLITSGSSLTTILAAIRKEKGEMVVVAGDKIPLIRRLPTGIFELDFYLGGGFPCGRYSICYGPESSGKTNVALRAAVMAQRLPPPCNKVVWCNTEQCVAGTSIFLDPVTGIRYTAKEVYEGKIPLQVHSYNESSGRIELRPLNAWFDNGIKPVFEVATASTSLTCTSNSRFWARKSLKCPPAWVRTDCIEPGWYVSRPRGHKRFKGGLLWSKVKSILPKGEVNTYDFTVDETHNFVVNDIVVHNTFDPVWASTMGVKVEDVLVVNAGYGEEAVDLVDALVRADDVALVVVDSLAALVANKELAQSAENYDIGSSALLIKRMVNKLMYAFGNEIKRGHDPCVILINQTRYQPGVLYGDPEKMPGGEAQKFLCSLRVRFNAKNIADPETNQVMFKETHAVVKKAKIPVRAIDFDFKLCVLKGGPVGIGETDSFPMVKNILQQLEVMVKTNKGYIITGIDSPCGVCVGKGKSKTTCVTCSGTGKLQRVWPTITSMQDEYLADKDFCAQLQKLTIDSYHHNILVEEPELHVVKDVIGGTPIPSI